MQKIIAVIKGWFVDEYHHIASDFDIAVLRFQKLSVRKIEQAKALEVKIGDLSVAKYKAEYDAGRASNAAVKIKNLVS